MPFPFRVLALVAGLLVTRAAHSAPASEEAASEAVCNLPHLYTAQKALYGEKDRYGTSMQEAGFLPLTCLDGSRAEAAGEDSVGGCAFVYRILEAGRAPGQLLAEARGVRGRAQGLRFVIDAQGRVTGDGVEVPSVDCEAWGARTDPLRYYREVVQEKDCIGATYSPLEPCGKALLLLMRRASEGLGMARVELAQHPHAGRIQIPQLSRPEMDLCGPDQPREVRERAVETLARKKGLASAVRVGGCDGEGQALGLRRLLREPASMCPGPDCIALLTQARRGVPDALDAFIQEDPERMARFLWDSADRGESHILSEVLGLHYESANYLTVLLRDTGETEDSLPSPEFADRLPRDAVSRALLAKARELGRDRSLHLAMAEELAGGPMMSRADFSTWASGVHCLVLDTAHHLRWTKERVERLIQERRCPLEMGELLSVILAKLPPEEVEGVVALPQLPLREPLCHALQVERGERSEALVRYVVERAPALLRQCFIGDACLTGPVAEALLEPDALARLGGREQVLSRLAFGHGRSSSSRGVQPGCTPEGETRVARELLRDRPSLQLARYAARLWKAGPEVKAALGSLPAPEASRILAAVGAGLAEAGAGDIPPEAARACVSDLDAHLGCLARVEAGMHTRPPPPYEHTSGYCGVGEPTREEKEAGYYCNHFTQRARECGEVCGGLRPSVSAIERLVAAAGAGARPFSQLRNPSRPSPAWLARCEDGWLPALRQRYAGP